MAVLIAFCTFPDRETAHRLAQQLVDQRLVACANLLPAVHSIYRWQGKVESADEVLVVFKLPATRYAEFETALQAGHPYDVPEIVALQLDRGLPDYLRWVLESCA